MRRGGSRQEEILGIKRVVGLEMGMAKKEGKHVGECGVVITTCTKKKKRSCLRII